MADNSQENWRLGGTLAFPVTRQHSIKLYGNAGVYSGLEPTTTSSELPGSKAGEKGYRW
jgi:hypothetical protein